MGLTSVANRPAGTLSYGHQRRLEIARCMITEPRLLMLDEPAAGLNPQEKIELQHLIDKLRREFGVSVLLIEHDMSLVMGVSDRILVMEHGRPIVIGTPEAVRNDPRVIKAYLGKSDAEAGTGPYALRRGRGARGRVDRGEQGRDRHADRQQRRRQDDADDDRVRHAARVVGRVLFEGKDITAMSTHQIMRQGWRSRRKGGACSRA